MNKDQKLIAEVYQRIFKESDEQGESSSIPSETFKDSYCIFVSGDSAPAFAKAVQEKGFENEGVRVLKGNFEGNKACVVIPIKADYKKIETELFALPEAKNVFGVRWEWDMPEKLGLI